MGRVCGTVIVAGRSTRSFGIRKGNAVKKRIVRVSPVQAGKVMAVFYGIFSIPFVLIMALIALAGKNPAGLSVLLVLLLPVLYLVFGFIFAVIAAWLYNVVAKWTGGIEFETIEHPGA